LRHALVDQRGEWQQRIHAVLFHHGHQQKAGLLTAANRAWMGQLAPPSCVATRAARPAVARSWVSTASVSSPPSRSSPSSATRAASAHRDKRSAPPAWTSPSINPTSAARPDTSLAKDRPHCAGRSTKPPRPPGGRAVPTAPTTTRPPSASAATEPASHWRAAAQAQLPRPARPRRPGPAARLTEPAVGARAALIHTDAPRPAPQMPLPPRSRGRPTKTERPQRVTLREHPINHHVTDPEPRVADRDKPGRPHAPHPPRPPRPRPTLRTDVTPEVDATDRHR
jgi:hypothetical protein